MGDYKIQRERDHFVLLKDGQFVCTGDTFRECEQEYLKIQSDEFEASMAACLASLQRGFYNEGDVIRV